MKRLAGFSFALLTLVPMMLTQAVLNVMAEETKRNNVAVLPTRSWKPGDKWDLAVELFASDVTTASSDRSPMATYSMHVLIGERERVGDTTCWPIDFIIPRDELPAGMPDHRRLLVGRTDGWTRKVVGSSTPHPLILFAPDGPAIAGTAIGFPLELSPLDQKHLQGGKPRTELTITPQTRGDRIILDTKIETVDQPEVRIRQTWVAGEKWWREYERSINGRKDLRARRLLPASIPAGRSGTSPLQDKQTELLRRDPRLQTLLTLNIKGQSLQAFLDLLSERIDARLEMASALAEEQPMLGGLSMRSTPAWRVMQQLAHQNVTDGYWEKTEAGYRLCGTHAVSRLPASTSPSPVEDSSTGRWILTSIVAALLAGVSGWLIVRARRKKAVTARV